MADSKREAAIEGVKSTLETAAGAIVWPSGLSGTPAVIREESKEPDEDETQLIVVGDGDPGDPEVLLSPLVYSYRHVVPVEIQFAHKDQEKRIKGLDAILQAVAAAFEADDSLGGAVDYAELTAPDIDEDSEDGALAFRFARFEAILSYDSPTPLG